MIRRAVVGAFSERILTEFPGENATLTVENAYYPTLTATREKHWVYPLSATFKERYVKYRFARVRGGSSTPEIFADATILVGSIHWG